MTQAESRLSRKIMIELRSRGAWVYKVHGGPMTMVGVPDIVGVWKGLFIALETKMPAGECSRKQLWVHEQIREAGGIVVVPRSVDQAIEMLEEAFSERRARIASRRS